MKRQVICRIRFGLAVITTTLGLAGCDTKADDPGVSDDTTASAPQDAGLDAGSDVATIGDVTVSPRDLGAADTTPVRVSDVPVPRASTHRAVLVVHADPYDGDVCAPGGPWDSLRDLVDAADERHHRLTILFTADWADCIADNAGRLGIVAGWVQGGHQIGFHHHDCSHTVPDGYRSPDIVGCTPACLHCGGKANGTAAEALAKVRQIAAGVVTLGVPAPAAAIDTANMGPDRWCATGGPCFRQYEWDRGLHYGTEQVEANPAPSGSFRFLTSPSCRSYGDGTSTYSVVELGHAQLDVGNFVTINAENNHETLAAELDVLDGGFVGEQVHAGVVFHAHEFTDTPRDDPSVAATDRGYLIAVMDLLAAKNFHTVPVREVLRSSTVCP